jgi:uncharacterized repeat protein (TIGR02543 family)
MNDGTDANWATKTVTVPATTVTDFPINPTRTGYDFGSWNTAVNGTETAFTTSTTVGGNITVYAIWDPYSYTVTFDKNGGDTEAVPAEKTVTSPDTTVGALPAPPSRNGYNFAGWDTLAGGGGSVFSDTTVVSADTIVYAQWTAKTYAVTFKQNHNGSDDTVLYTKSVTVPATTITDFPADPTRTGYNFGSWNTAANGTGTKFTAGTPVNDTITVYAIWDTYSYTVNFDKNGGDTEAVPAEKTVTSPATTVDALPAPPSRADHNFGGWNTKLDGTGTAFTPTTTVSGPITVYAKWNTTSIILNPDDGDGAFTQTSFALFRDGGIESQTVTVTGLGYTNPRWFVDGGLAGTGTSVTIHAADYSPGSHTLGLQVNKNGVSWSKEISFTVDAGAWTVIFRTNNGTGAIYTVRTAAAGSVISGFPGNPVRAGYDFVEWKTQADGGGSVFDSTTPVTTDTTVYAQWTGKIYTVTFKQNYNSSDDDVVDTKTVTFPVVTLGTNFPTAPSWTNYNFAGWNTQRNGSGEPFGQSSVVNGDITVYATWAHKQFNITLDIDAGGGAFSQEEFTLTGTESQTVTVTGTGYTNPRWVVDGGLVGTGNSVTISAANYTAGGHSLTLIISKNGASWSKGIAFTVTN